VDVFELGMELVKKLKEKVKGGFKHEEMVDDH